MDFIEFHHEPPSNLTTMVVAFGGWIDAGRAATGAVRYLVQHLSATLMAAIDPEAFVMFTQQRPIVRLTAPGIRDIRWPKSEFFMWQPPDGRDGLLLFYGMEPNQKWQTYTKALLDVADQCGVKRIVSIGAVLARLPHTRPPRVTGRSTDPDWTARLEEWGIYRRPSYEGPIGISTVVLEAATRRGIPSLSFSGLAPHYLRRSENPAVIQTLLTYVNRLLDLKLDVAQLDEAVTAFRSHCDQIVAQEPALQDYIRELEQADDSRIDEEARSRRDDDPTSEKLMQEVEDFLREERGGGGGGGLL